MGRNGALHDAQPALSLDAPRAEDRLRRDEAARSFDGPRDLRPLHRPVAEARIPCPRPDAALSCRGGLHDGRSRGFAGTPHQGPRGQFRREDASHVASRQGDGRGGSRRFPRLHRQTRGGFGRLDLEIRRCDRRPARASQILRIGGLPPFRPRHRGVLRRGLHPGRDRRYF